MMIQIHQKSIPTAQLQHRLVQGESNIEKVVFFVPNVPNIDFSVLIFTIKLLAEDAGKIVIGELDMDPTENGILLSWDVSKKYTRYGGGTRLQIDGADATGNIVYRALSEKFCMRKELTGEDAVQDPEPDPEAGYVPPIESGDNGKYLRAMNGEAIWGEIDHPKEIFWVELDTSAMECSHSPTEILEAVNKGLLVMGHSVVGNLRYYCTGVDTTFAAFEYYSSTEEYAYGEACPEIMVIRYEVNPAKGLKYKSRRILSHKKLPNPFPLEFEGAVTGSYDGSAPKKIKIPEAKEYTLPAASETALGGVKAIPKTEEMTIPVGIDENGQLWIAPIYAPIEPGNTYNVTSILIGVESDNPSAVVAEGSPYRALLTVADGYEITKVIVTMGGVDITADVYADGTVNIPAVTGDVIVTASAVAPTDIMSHFKWLGATTHSPGTYVAWCPTGLIYDAERDVYAHFMLVQNAHYATPNACELWFNTIDPETLEHSEPVYVARTAEKLTGNLTSAGALGCCIKNGNYYMFADSEKGYYCSTDGGNTWTHEQYENGPDKCPWGCYVLDNGRMIMGSDTQNHKIYYSDDNGKNWTAVQSSNFNEPTFIDFGGGTVMAICRENMDADKNIQKPWMHVSNDYGETWTDAVAMETVGYMGNNSCNAYVHDNFVELFVGCRIPTGSPQYTDTLYQINQYVMDLSKGAVDGFEFVNTVYQYKNDDNPQGITTTFTGADDFSTPCIAIKDKAHSLLTFYAPTGQSVTHHFIAVGNIPVDEFEIPSLIPTSYTASQTFEGSADTTTITVCESYGIGTEGNYPSISSGYIKLDDIMDGGFAHVRLLSNGFGDASNKTWRYPPFVSVKDGKVLSASRWSALGKSPMPEGATTFNGMQAACTFDVLSKEEALDVYAFIKDDHWWSYLSGTWVRNDQAGIPISGLTWSSIGNSSELAGNYYEGLETYKTFSGGNGNFRKIKAIEYDKKSS